MQSFLQVIDLNKCVQRLARLGGRAKRRGYYCTNRTTSPLFEGTPPNLGGEFKVLDNIYIIAKIFQRL